MKSNSITQWRNIAAYLYGSGYTVLEEKPGQTYQVYLRDEHLLTLVCSFGIYGYVWYPCYLSDNASENARQASEIAWEAIRVTRDGLPLISG